MFKNKEIMKPVIIACSAGLLLTACATSCDEASYSSADYSSATIQEPSGAQSGWQAGSSTYSPQQYSSSQQQQSQQQYSTQQSYSSSQAGQAQSGNEVIIPLHEEQLNVGKRTVDAGTVTIRKIVTTETVNQPVELRRETLVIDREGAGAQTRSSQFQSSTGATQRQSSGAGFNAQAGSTGAGVQAQAGFDQAEPAGATTRGATSGQQSFSSSGAAGTAFQEQTYTIQLREEQPVIEKNVVQTGQVTARKNTQTQRQNVQQQVRREDVRLDQGANARNVEIRGNFDSAGRFSEPSGAQIQRE